MTQIPQTVHSTRFVISIADLIQEDNTLGHLYGERWMTADQFFRDQLTNEWVVDGLTPHNMDD